MDSDIDALVEWALSFTQVSQQGYDTKAKSRRIFKHIDSIRHW